mmetsp:Transcript_16984/g.26305  ORF Transcript_16984/g.26305 Transcript_16984/m.26305 type:complete len:422 (-) Transcript_16984:624-1889(-)|eukprot:CAMPEP_0195308802 /NCGR_PEP_ID=MMETSP0707-20130614/38414_1 /TAXON_ID=33640 /ORGANISM="Asterionellopsis glacialis, Strain CCMP134" /LENGTH=421 /DNA_ID=CAMNT_0040373089 /DNA_START=134 /DNA_END=1399 /DNA_ORIENTATION=+
MLGLDYLSDQLVAATAACNVITTPPPPMDDNSVSDPLQCPPLRWGLVGCGRVCHDFTQSLKNLPTATVVACAARKVESAKAFAERHGIEKYYGGYDDLLADSNVECVYVGNIHIFRRQIVEKCLRANKNVLVEKPFACSVNDAEYLIGLARERDLFVMEGMWTRFFPAVEQARRLAHGRKDSEGILGDVVSVHSDFNFSALDCDEYPKAAIFNHKLGGGASFAIAPYPIAAAALFYRGAMPEKIFAVGNVDERTGVDLQANLALSFPSLPDKDQEFTPECQQMKRPASGLATLSIGLLGESKEETSVLFTEGRLTIGTPCHCPTKLSVDLKGSGRGNYSKTLVYEFPLPVETDEIKKSGSYFYPNSAGFAYEAAAVARCIAAGKKEAPQHTLADTLVNITTIEELRNQLGVKPIDSDLKLT